MNEQNYINALEKIKDYINQIIGALKAEKVKKTLQLKLITTLQT